MGDKAASRIVTVVWPFDPVLRAMRFWLPLVAAAAAALLTVLMRTKPTAIPLAAGIVVAGVVIGAQQYKHYSDRLVASVYRRHALAIIDGVDGHSGHWFARMLTSWTLKAPRFEYAAQKELLSALLDACRSGPAGQFWFVEGGSGSGKSRTALLLAQTLLCDAQMAEKNRHHCLLYDFASEESQRRLAARLGSAGHGRRVVIVDNFHLATSHTLGKVSRILLDRPSPLPELLIVLMARPRHYWSTSPEGDVALVEDAKEHGRHASLTGPVKDQVAKRLRALNPELDGVVRTIGLDDRNHATGVQMHIAQAFARRGLVTDVVTDVANAVFAEPPRATPDDIAAVLAVASGLAVHRGAFTRREFRRAARRVAAGPLTGGATNTRAMRRKLRSMQHAGLVQSSQSRARLVFHEALAESCIDRLWGHAVFRPALAEVVRMRIDAANDAETERWLLASELNDVEPMVNGFDYGASAGAYGRMVQCLDRLAARDPNLEVRVRIQYAVLLDRVGRFSESRREFATVDQAALEHLAPFATMLLANRIEASHGEAAEQDAALLAASGDPVVADIGRYWQLHMAAHHGSFAPGPLREIAQRLDRAQTAHDGHWLRYATLRAHVDSFRHLYLSGDASPTSVANREWRIASARLHQTLAITEAFETLYTRAHLIAHVLLPDVAIHGGVISEGTREMLGLRDGPVDPDRLVAAARREYRRARRQFEQYGDREALYLQVDELNMEMVVNGGDLDAARHRLDEYQEFITASGFEDLLSYPLVYRWRWHMLSYFDILLRQPAAGARTEPHLRRALECLERAAALDRACGNQYGDFRARFLLGITRWLDRSWAPVDRGGEMTAWISAQQQEASSRGYGIEVSVLSWLAANAPPSPEELLRIFRFYPVVHQ